MKAEVTLRVNGAVCHADVEPRTLLVQLLRETLGLTGTHVGCVVGECGACSVLVDDVIVKSCLMLAVQARGHDVTTVEGLAQDGRLSAIQSAFVAHSGLQCGFCTPGFLMASHALLKRTPHPAEAQIRQDLSSNLCMCTGYMNIVRAVLDAASSER